MAVHLETNNSSSRKIDHDHRRRLTRDEQRKALELGGDRAGIGPRDNYARLDQNAARKIDSGDRARERGYESNPTWWQNGTLGASGRPFDAGTSWNVTRPNTGADPANPAPTPLRQGDAPGQQAISNTIQNPNNAPKSQMRGAVNAAIDKVRAAGIGMDPNDPERNTIANYDQYHNAVVAELNRQGYRAAYDGEELAVGRRGDNFSEQFDISTSSGKVRRFYAAWLSPPAFADGLDDGPKADPTAPRPSQLRESGPNDRVFVNSIQNRNVAPKSEFMNEVNAAIDRVRAQGLGIDTNDPERKTITNFDVYHNAVVAELRRRGFEAAYDGEELAVGKKGGSHSEQFDISTWTGLVRRFYAAWHEPPVVG